jgi:hypothetical protein
MNTLQRAYLIAIALLTCITLFSCSEQTAGDQGHKGAEQAAQGQPRSPEDKSEAKSHFQNHRMWVSRGYG